MLFVKGLSPFIKVIMEESGQGVQVFMSGFSPLFLAQLFGCAKKSEPD